MNHGSVFARTYKKEDCIAVYFGIRLFMETGDVAFLGCCEGS